MGDLSNFRSALPEFRDWIDKTLDEHSSHAIKVSSIKSSKIKRALPVEILDRARVVLVEKPLPVPELKEMGFPELAELENIYQTLSTD